MGLVISICYLFSLRLLWSNLATLQDHHCVWHGVPIAVLPSQAGRGWGCSSEVEQLSGITSHPVSGWLVVWLSGRVLAYHMKGLGF